MKVKNHLLVLFLFFILSSNLYSDENNKKLKVGLLAPLSGTYSDIGNSLLNSLQLALEEINDENVIIVPRDSGLNNIEKLDSAIKDMKLSGVKIIIGPIFFKNLEYLNEINDYIDENLKKSKIKFHGHLPQKNISKLVFNSSILILPSYEETAPMVISEAMALGTPVISTKVAGIPWMIEDGVTGHLFEAGNYKELFTKIIIILKDESLDKFSKNMRSKAESLYHPEVVAKKTFDVYKKIIDEL